MKYKYSPCSQEKVLLELNTWF